MNKKVTWTKTAKKSLDKYCEHIAKDSVAASKIVRKELVFTAKKLPLQPEKYQIEEYYPNNKGDIRRFFRWGYRVIYQIREESIVVLDVIHTSRHPDRIK